MEKDMVRESFVVCLKDHTWFLLEMDFEMDVDIEEDTTSDELVYYLQLNNFKGREDIAHIAHIDNRGLCQWEVPK